MKKISLLLLIVTLLTSCDEDTVELPEDCTACQEAIDQMAGDLYNCDPDYSTAAWDLMDINCGVMTKTYIGFMAETCKLGELVSPKCGRFESISFKGVPLDYTTCTRSLPEPVDVTVQYDQDYKFHNEEDDFLARGGSDNFEYDTTDHNFAVNGCYSIPSRNYPHTLIEGAVITVTLYKAGTDDELASAENIFSFERSELDWHQTRTILINFTEDSEYTIGFTDWKDWD